MLGVLVLGGYGFFGARICAALARDPHVRLIIAGRDLAKAAALAHRLELAADQALQVDARHPAFTSWLRLNEIGALVHAAGPFQGQDYGVARAAIAAGCHYVDLADGRAFVAGISTLNESARAANVTVVSGASSLPALSSAVVDRYLPRFRSLRAIRVGIASGARAPGLATMRGILGYCGRPFAAFENGAPLRVHGWMDTIARRFPAPLGRRLLSRCDVPDLELFPGRYRGVEAVSFHAGFASGLGHRAVVAGAALVRAGILGNLAPFAGALHRIAGWMEPLVSDCGGMFVDLDGTGLDDTPLGLSWNLVARNHHGPHIPTGAAIALTRKLAAHRPLPRGAMPCMGLLSVGEILAPLRALDIQEIAP